MSFTTILKAARKLGMPVVITDREGAEAQVVMPFDDFLALTNSVQPERTKRGVASGEFEPSSFTPSADRDEDLTALFRAEEQGSMEFSIEDVAAMQSPEAPRPPVPPNGQKAGGPAGMEEKFYLEPIDEENF